MRFFVIPAKAGIRTWEKTLFVQVLDPGLRRGDEALMSRAVTLNLVQGPGWRLHGGWRALSFVGCIRLDAETSSA